MAFKHISEVTKETETYIDLRRKGLIKSLKTGFPKLDNAGLGGIAEWRSTVTIGARPGKGKTIFSNCLLRNAYKHNDISEIVVLDYTWEMSSRSLLLRELAGDSKNTYKDIISAGNLKVTDEAFVYYKGLLEGYNKLPVFFEEDPKTVKEFADSVKKKRDSLKGKKIIVRLDHTLLTRRAASEAGGVEMLYNLLFETNQIKKQSDIIFIILSQLNRDIEDRQESGTDAAFPRMGDMFNGDATSMFSETMILLNRPSDYGITYYGRNPNGISVENDDLFVHMAKARNSEANLIIRYKTDFATMNITEV